MNKTLKFASIPAAAGLIIGGVLMIAPASASSGCDTTGGSYDSAFGNTSGNNDGSIGTVTDNTSTDDNSGSGVGGVSEEAPHGSTSTDVDSTEIIKDTADVGGNEILKDTADVGSFLNNLFGDSLLNIDGGIVNVNDTLVDVDDVANGPIASGNDVDAPVANGTDIPVANGTGNNTKVDVPVKAPVANDTKVKTWVDDTIDSTLDGVTGDDGILNNLLGR